MEEIDRVLSQPLTKDFGQEAKNMACKLYSQWLIAAKEKDDEEHGTYFCDILMRNRDFKIKVLAMGCQTLINKGEI